MIKQVIQEGFSDGSLQWERTRQQQSEVLGYKLTGKQDIKSKPTKLEQQQGFRKKR